MPSGATPIGPWRGALDLPSAPSLRGRARPRCSPFLGRDHVSRLSLRRMARGCLDPATGSVATSICTRRLPAGSCLPRWTTVPLRPGSVVSSPRDLLRERPSTSHPSWPLLPRSEKTAGLKSSKRMSRVSHPSPFPSPSPTVRWAPLSDAAAPSRVSTAQPYWTPCEKLPHTSPPPKRPRPCYPRMRHYPESRRSPDACPGDLAAAALARAGGAHPRDKKLGQHPWRLPSGTRKPRDSRGFPEAAEGTRTLDLLHGKQTL